MGTLTVDNLNVNNNITGGNIKPNTPAFFAYLSATQTLTNNAYNKVNCDTEVFDSDGL